MFPGIYVIKADSIPTLLYILQGVHIKNIKTKKNIGKCKTAEIISTLGYIFLNNLTTLFVQKLYFNALNLSL